MRYIVLDKPVGQTPLEAIKTWQASHQRYVDTPASYAGRLDPMASGKLLVLLGGECRKQKEYTGLDKEYEIEVVLDLSTDTGDALGMPTYSGKEIHPSRDQVASALEAMKGSHSIPYPAFSSKTVSGKPLFMYALEGTLSTIEIPTHEETIYRVKLLERRSLSKSELEARITSALAVVPRSEEASKVLGADFRQDEIRKRWSELFTKIPDRRIDILRLRVACASSTYMRTLASRIAAELGTTALALSIRRTRIGRFAPRLGWWIRSY